MRDEISVQRDCVCGGRLLITGAPWRLRRQVEVLVQWFEQEHGDHGTSGVREPRSHFPPDQTFSWALDQSNEDADE